jgi:chromosome partitioning protein
MSSTARAAIEWSPTLIITVAQQKGGAGKTTLLVQLATALAAAGRQVALVDIDPQASLTGWMRLREQRHDAKPPGADDTARPPPLRLATVAGWRVEAEIERLKREVDAVLVDTPPHAESEAKAAIRGADLVLVPVQPSPADLWASSATVQLARKENRRGALLLNRVPARGRVVEETLAAIQREGWPVLDSRLGNRTSHVTSFARGQGVIEAEPRSLAAQEVRALLRELALV